VVSFGALIWHGQTTHRSLVPPRSFADRFIQPITCILKMTTGGLLSAGECWFLPLPLPALIAGKTPLAYQFSVKKGGKDTDR